ncbi:BatD family protein [Desulfosediminicola flagellatus]|uniref:BatD family protein n=1 Tax=Desulfosediminicola flagellatus TaxID=2569541 RepID=UPI0010AD6090|nr:BatD family protein [Desulfosediminicola flagellatus]
MRKIDSTIFANRKAPYLLVAFVLIALIAFPCVNSALSKSEITVSAKLGSASFSVDEGAQLTITINGTRSANLEIPETNNFDIYQRGKSSQFNMINGEFSASISVTCLLQAHQPGKYTIPPISIHADGTTITTEPIPFEVTASGRSVQQPAAAGSGQQTQTGNADEKGAFILLVNEKQKSYIGEIIPIEIKAYFRQGLRANLNSTPSIIGDGFVMPQLHDQPRQTQERVGNSIYNVLTWKTTLSTIKEGAHTIRIELDATQLIPQRRTSTSIFGSRSPFDDDFFDSVLGGYSQRPLKVTSEDIALEILPLPEEGRPEDFTGAIGDFSLETQAEPRKVETGEPITLTISVHGSGNFDRVEAPIFPSLPEWKTYSANSQYSPDKSKTPVDKKVFEQAIVAKSPSITEIPSLSFSYFDPQKGIYVTKKSAPLPITVSGKAAPAPATATIQAPQPQKVQIEENTALFHGLAPIKIEPGKAVRSIKPLYRKPFFIAVMVICFMAILYFFLIKTMQLRAQRRPEAGQMKQLSAAMKKSFTAIDESRMAENSAAFLAACRSAIQHHLGTLWGCQPTTITRADIAEKLPQHPELLEIFTAAEQSAYGGANLSRETMEDYTRKLKTTLETLI